MGPLYFLSLLKVMLFGFRVSGGSQINFVYDELQTIGEDGKQSQGPNAVIAMINWALKQHCPLASSFSIHADNCPGQNKNRFVLGYFMWRVLTGQNKTIEYLMQTPGHARSHVDSGFAAIKND
ncbi:uncharacterized protein LOC127876128 [Dreissena polymorpha]|uniref:uncharacterized protein LOC127876128 n=1 Tax=Dreissena polymorpha TaxID=45954 RepID=UPI002264A471|nr:uncharacterized protein LOC127876128 [Dreissena polymorpha]